MKEKKKEWKSTMKNTGRKNSCELIRMTYEINSLSSPPDSE